MKIYNGPTVTSAAYFVAESIFNFVNDNAEIIAAGIINSSLVLNWIVLVREKLKLKSKKKKARNPAGTIANLAKSKALSRSEDTFANKLAKAQTARDKQK